MKKISVVGLVIMLVVGAADCAMALSERALAYRKANDLIEYAVPKAFLEGSFVANEENPRYIFSSVNDLLKACVCKTTWLIEKGELQRIGGAQQNGLEYTVYLEADCPDKTNYYAFVVQQNSDPEKWLKWRWQFHKNKAESEYGEARDRFKQAFEKGLHLAGELRFMVTDGELDMRNPEDVVLNDFRLVPIYDFEKEHNAGK